MTNESVRWQFWQQWLRQPSAEAPLLIVAPPETDWPQVAATLARNALCGVGHTSASPTDCKVCTLIASGTHPDFVHVVPTRATIGVEEIRELRQRLVGTPWGAQRLLIMDSAERLTVPAANALLKFLEEPHVSTRIVLTTSWPRRILPTIRSRSQRLLLPEECQSVREVITYDDDEAVAQAAEGLLRQFYEQGPQPAVKRGLLRLRDYYVIGSRQGNRKLAREVLLASLE